MSHLLPKGDTMPKQTTDPAIAALTLICAMATFAVILATSFLTLTASTGHAASPRVRSACSHDYLAFCSQHPQEGPAVRKCMDANGSKLSKTCVDALVADGEISRSSVERRRTASQR